MSRGEHPLDELRRTGKRPPRLDVVWGPANDVGVPADELDLAESIASVEDLSTFLGLGDRLDGQDSEDVMAAAAGCRKRAGRK